MLEESKAYFLCRLLCSDLKGWEKALVESTEVLMISRIQSCRVAVFRRGFWNTTPRVKYIRALKPMPSQDCMHINAKGSEKFCGLTLSA